MQTETQKYNGWTNRATWNLALWASNDESTYNYVQSQKPYNCEKARRVAKEIYGTQTPDGCKLSAVHWKEIADAWNE